MTIEIPSPETTHSLLGHEEAEAQLISHMASGMMPHSWLITGPKGVGKATLAYRLARAVLAGTAGQSLELPEDHPVTRRVLAGSHTDMLTIQSAAAEGTGTSQEISVEKAREIGKFLALTPAESDWRVVIVDSVDDMNTNAANSILKILEEPPARSLLLLISHNPGRLLPTILSRCRRLRLGQLSEDAFHRVITPMLPEADREHIQLLGVLSGFSPGIALEMESLEAADSYRWLLDYFARGEGSLVKFADQLQAGEIHANWKALSWVLSRLLSRATQYGIAPEEVPPAISGEEQAFRAMLAITSPKGWAERASAVSQQFSVAARSHLDYKTVLICLLQDLKQAQPA